MTKKNNQLLMLLSTVGLLTFTACTDDKYDLNDLDTTIGVGSDEGLTLPTSSTRQIFLDDLLELNNSESVVIRENGDYVFEQKGDNVEPVEVMIDKISILDNGSTNFPLEINIPNLPADLTPLVGQTFPGTADSLINQTIYTLEYAGDKPEEIRSLQSVDADGTFAVNINFSENLSRFIPSFKTFRVEFPSYMEVEVQGFEEQYEVKDGHILQARDGVSVKTDKRIEIAVNIKKLNVDGDGVKVTDDQMIMEGSVKVSIAWDDIVVGSSTLSDLQLNSALSINDLSITGATGSFSPKIELNDLGNVNIGELPDFLTNENVSVDLYNPQIVIDIESDLSVPGYLRGTLVAHKNDGTEVSVDIPRVTINAVEDNGGRSHIMICRREENVPDSITQVVAVKALKDIIAALPQTSTISFSAVAGADPRDGSRIELGKAYTIKPSYSIEAPIAFGRNARIVYTDTLDGWNDDLQDIEFANEAYVSVTADIENRIPAYLMMSAHAIDVNGNEIDNLTVDIDSDIQASEDGTTAVTTPISVTIKQKSAGALKAVDGIVFTIAAAAADSNGAVEGITLNAYNHSLLAKNIKVTLKGKVVIDTDD